MDQFFKRTWVEININALEANYRAIKELVGDKTKIMCVIKADAYGHGAEFLASLYQRLDADWLAVSNLEEAIQIRKTGVLTPILILGYTPANMAEKLCEYSIAQTVISLDYAKQLQRYASKCERKIDAHIKLDTGMNRLGLPYHGKDEEQYIIDEISMIYKLDNLNVQGIFTHFAVADNQINGNEYTNWQFINFNDAIEKLKQKGIEFPLKHCSNSAGILAHRSMNMDMVRAGVILYGLMPSKSLRGTIKLYPAMQWKTVISQIKQVDPGTSISYGRTFFTDKKTKIATIPVGYADGYPRNLSGKAEMLVCGKRVPIVGTICMDQLMLDVSTVPQVNKASTVTILGHDGNEQITFDELSDLNGTINYELACIIGKRVPRIFLKDKKNVGQLNYICPQSM